LIYSVFSVEQHTKLGDALNFFVHDTLKILLLQFLITSPLVHEVAIALFVGMKATIIYVSSGILLGMHGGYFLGKLKLEKLLTPWVQKGIPIGAAIACMMSVVGLSIPEAMLLKKVMSLKNIRTFFAVITLFNILSGYLFPIIL
jgi:uncharacterized membrane protein YraQ (UPF0718 family)